MEYFPARCPCPLHLLPTFASMKEAQDIPFLGVTFVGYPRAGHLTFCESPPANGTTDPAFDCMVLITRDHADQFAAAWPAAKLLCVDDPRALFIDTLDYLQRNDLIDRSSLLPKAPSASQDARIGAGAIIEADVQIDADVTVGCGAVVRAGTWLKQGVTIGSNCVIGEEGINAYSGLDGRRRGFPHLAGVIIGEGSSVGAGCVVARGILSSTLIGKNNIIGSICNIGHGVEIDDDVWISVGTLVGGHSKIHAGATIAMGCTIRDNIRIGARASVGMGSVVTKHVRAGGSVFGNPARSYAPIKAGPSR